MSLIKQLGGYERAKDVFSKMTHSCERGYIQGKGVFYSYIGLQNALLQYRRQHNIFEESDKIVFVDEFMHGELMTVAWVRNGEVWMDDGAKLCTDLRVIRHATDAEIEAGKRL